MYDVIVIGGGPAGVTAALRARELGATVALVERGRMGGTCTNDGCVPTRVLAKAARLARDSEQFADYGLTPGERPVVDMARLMARTRQVIDHIHEKKQLLDHLDEAGVHVLANAGEAQFLDPHTVTRPARGELRGDKFLLCVGGHARRLPFPGCELTLTHSDIWDLTALPRSLVIVGGAATGCQLASIFRTFGSEVFLLEMAPRLLPGEDVSVSQALTEAFERHGIQICTGIGGIERIEETDGARAVHYRHDEQARTIHAEIVVMAVGWPGNIEALNLSVAGVYAEKGYIPVNDALQTSAPHIFAAGDITGRMMLVQSAGDEARIAAENAVLGTGRADTHEIVPHGSFTDPEYGSVGLTEEKARKQEECAVAVVPYADLDRAVIDGRVDGFCKLIASRTSHQVLGAHVVGEQALEVIQIIAAGMAAGMRIDQMADLELAYPTFAGIVGLAARHLSREMGLVSQSPQWRAHRHPRAAEWERNGNG